MRIQGLLHRHDQRAQVLAMTRFGGRGRRGQPGPQQGIVQQGAHPPVLRDRRRACRDFDRASRHGARCFGNEGAQASHRHEQRHHQQQSHARHEVQPPADRVHGIGKGVADLPDFVLFARFQRRENPAYCFGTLLATAAEGYFVRLVGRGALSFDAGKRDRRAFRDKRYELFDQPELYRVVSHPVAQVGQQKRNLAPSALERLEIGFIGRQRKAAAGRFDVVDRGRQRLRSCMVARFRPFAAVSSVMASRRERPSHNEPIA